MSGGLSQAAHLHAIGDLYTEHHGWLRGWLHRKLGSASQAADLTQDTFVRILSAPVRATDIREPRSYLATIANRVMIDHLRRQTLEHAYLEALAHLPEPVSSSPETRALVFETLCEIDAMLQGLGEKARQAFLWSQLEGLGYAEIATRLGVSISSVRKYVARATECCLLYALDHDL